MNTLRVDIYANGILCGNSGERQLICSINTNSTDKYNIVKIYQHALIKLEGLNNSHKEILSKLTVLENLGNGRAIKLQEFDIECMKRVVDVIDSHPDFECFYDKNSHDDSFNMGYDNLALICKNDNSLIMKISRGLYDEVEHIYVSKSLYSNMFGEFIDGIKCSKNTNGEIIKTFDYLNRNPRFNDEFEFRMLDWDIISENLFKSSSIVGIECSLPTSAELISDLPLFNITYTKLNDYYTSRGFKHTSIIENLVNEKKISNDLVNKINDLVEEGTIESLDDLEEEIDDLFKISGGLIFDIILDEGPVVSIDSDDYCNSEESPYLIDHDVDESESDDGSDDVIEDKQPIGFILMTDSHKSKEMDEMIAFAFQYNDNLYSRVCDNFIHELKRSDKTTELGNELSKINGKSFRNLYDFKDCIDTIFRVVGRVSTPSRLEILMDDPYIDICSFNKLMSITLINKRNNITIGKINLIKSSIDEKISVTKQVTINGYSSLNDDIREIVNKGLSELQTVMEYDSGNFASTLKSFVYTDEVELIVIKDGKPMYADKNTKIVYGSDGSKCFDINDSTSYDSNNCFSSDESYESSKNYKKHSKNNKALKNDSKITFDDVVGMEHVKDKLYDVIDQFKNRSKYAEWGIKPIRGVLLHGPSGTGKSFISEALANEVDARFVKKSSGDIMSKYIGQSGQNVKKIFDEARQNKGNTIIFIDEIDAIASKRSEEENKERNATLNELLVQMSSSENENIFMIFATNLVDVLDPAFLRSGRCDFKIEVPLPDFEMRKGILEKASGKRPLSDDLDFEVISRNMSGMNCADVAHISNEAARRALKAKKDKVDASDYEAAIEDMICGTNIKTTKLSDKEKTTTAYHEIGHFFMNQLFDSRKAKKISILPRGSALGFVLYANEKEDDKFLYTKDELLSRIKILLAGRAMEEIFLDDVSTGASDDLKKANNIARDIICKYGFNDSLLVLDTNDIMSRNKINLKVKELLDECYSEVKETLKSEKHLVESLSKYLYEKEDVTGDELIDYMNSIKVKNEN